MKEGKQILQKMYEAMPPALIKRVRYGRKPVFVISPDIKEKLKRPNGNYLKTFKGLKIISTPTLGHDHAQLG